MFRHVILKINKFIFLVSFELALKGYLRLVHITIIMYLSLLTFMLLDFYYLLNLILT